MAIDIFPLYEILVENIFGSIAVASIGIAFVLLLIFLITRTSLIFITYFLIFYFIVMGTLYLGALGLVLGAIVIFIYTITASLRFFVREG